MSDLQSYLARVGEKKSSFAERVGTTPATITRLCNGTLRPALELAHRIETATDGEVRTEVWLSGGNDAAGEPASEVA